MLLETNKIAPSGAGYAPAAGESRLRGVYFHKQH